MKLILLILLIALSVPAMGAEWEFKVVLVPGYAQGYVPLKDESGAYPDDAKTEILNNLSKDGWEVVAVTGMVGGDQTVYLKRKLPE